MTPQEIAQIITLARRAPLANMAEAESAAMLLQKLAQHFAPKVGDVPASDIAPQNRPSVANEKGAVDGDDQTPGTL